MLHNFNFQEISLLQEVWLSKNSKLKNHLKNQFPKNPSDFIKIMLENSRLIKIGKSFFDFKINENFFIRIPRVFCFPRQNNQWEINLKRDYVFYSSEQAIGDENNYFKNRATPLEIKELLSKNMKEEQTKAIKLKNETNEKSIRQIKYENLVENNIDLWKQMDNTKKN